MRKEEYPGWENWGDVDHYTYGGLFFKVEGDDLFVVETTPYAEIDPDPGQEEWSEIRDGYFSVSDLEQDEEVFEIWRRDTGSKGKPSLFDLAYTKVGYYGFDVDHSVTAKSQDEYYEILEGVLT